MENFVVFVDELDGSHVITLLLPFSQSGKKIEKLFKNRMQGAALKPVNLSKLANKIVVCTADNLDTEACYRVRIESKTKASKAFVSEMRKNYGALESPARSMGLEAAAVLPQSFDELINVPGSSANYLRGIDISHHNNLNDWKAIKDAGVSFVYIKTSEGVGTPDNMAQTNALLAKQNGLKVGYYHFGRPDTKNGGTVEKDAHAEAKEVKDLLSNLPTADLPLMLDLEDTASWDSPLQPADYLKWVESFLANFFSPANPANTPFIYSRKEYLDRKLPATHTLGSRYRLWLSRYTNDYQAAVPARGWADWHIWQFTEAGILGANSKLDLNIRKSIGPLETAFEDKALLEGVGLSTSRDEEYHCDAHLEDGTSQLEANCAEFPGPWTGKKWRVAGSLATLRQQVDALAPGRNKAFDGTIGDTAHQGRKSDHNPWVLDRTGTSGVVTALDITHDPSRGCDCNAIAQSLQAARDRRIKYVIWNNRIMSSTNTPWAWRLYDGSNPHTKHIHISVDCSITVCDVTDPWEIEIK